MVHKMKYRLTAMLLTGALLLLMAACSSTPNTPDDTPPAANNTAEPAAPALPEGALVIAEQGIFSAGGIVIENDGVFDPENQWEETGAGQTAHVDHANVLYQIPAEQTGLPKTSR